MKKRPLYDAQSRGARRRRVSPLWTLSLGSSLNTPIKEIRIKEFFSKIHSTKFQTFKRFFPKKSGKKGPLEKLKAEEKS